MGARVLISSMSAPQLHPLLIHSLLIPQVRPQPAHECMLHSCMRVCVRSCGGVLGRLADTHLNGAKHVKLLRAASERQTYLSGKRMQSIHLRALSKHVRVAEAWMVVRCVHLIDDPKSAVVGLHQRGVTGILPV